MEHHGFRLRLCSQPLSLEGCFSPYQLALACAGVWGGPALPGGLPQVGASAEDTLRRWVGPREVLVQLFLSLDFLQGCLAVNRLQLLFSRWDLENQLPFGRRKLTIVY